MYSSSKNILLQKDDVGRPKSTTRNLPPPNHTYGKSEARDKEGVGHLTTVWKYHNSSNLGKNDRDFKKLNRMSLQYKATDSHKMYNFRKFVDARLRPFDASRTNNAIRLPEDDFTYGAPVKPSTPIKEVLGNFYGELAEEEMIFKYHMKKAKKEPGLVRGGRPTSKSRIAADEVRRKQEEREKAMAMTLGSNVFKMNQFKNVKPRVY